MNTKGIKVISENKTHVNVSCAAGEEWHDFVLWTLENGYGGIENLSLIPEKTGTAPIQNIGAYGVELKDIFVSCEAIERETWRQKHLLRKIVILVTEIRFLKIIIKINTL